MSLSNGYSGLWNGNVGLYGGFVGLGSDGGLGGGESAFLVNIANHVNIPQDLLTATTTTNFVRFNAVKHTAGKANYTNIRMPYQNARYRDDLENPAQYDLEILEAGILYNNIWYPATFNGASNSGTLSKDYGYAITDVIAGLSLAADSEFYSFTKTVPTEYLSTTTTIIGITQANPGVVTYTGVDPIENDPKRFVSVGGMTQLNYATNGNVAYTVKNLNTSAKTFEIWNSAGSSGINTTGFTPYTSGGTANRVYIHYCTTAGTTITQDGAISGADPSVSITTIARGAKLLQSIDPSKITGGVLTTGTSTILKDPANLGQGYSGGLNMQLFYGTAGADGLGALHPGASAVATVSTSAGVLSSINVTSGGREYSSANPPKLYVGGTGTVSTGWGASVSMWGPIAIFGVPDNYTYPNILVFGDSYFAGAASFPDGSGPVEEHMFLTQQNAPIQRMATNGNSAVQWNAQSTQQLALIDRFIALGVRYTHFFNAMGVNDFREGNSLASVRVAMNTMNNTLRAKMPTAKVIVKKVEPSTTSTDTFLTLAGQTEYSAAYGAGGAVEQYNDSLEASNVTPIAYDYLSSLSDLARDAVTTHKWSIDVFKNTLNGTITAITNANPAVVTSTAHTLSTDNCIEITDGQTMTQVTGNRYLVTVIDANSFSLRTTSGAAVNSTLYTPFVGTGAWTRVDASTSDGVHRSGTLRQKAIDTGYDFTLTA